MGAFHAQTLTSLPELRLRYVVDGDVARARDAAAHGHDVRVLADAAALFAERRVAAVVIATPAATHGPLISAAAAAGIDVFCEKPLAVSLDEALAVATSVREAGIAFQIGFQRRFDAGIARLLASASAGELGRIETVRSVTADPVGPSLEAMRASAGIFHDTLSHDLDLAITVAGPIADVHAIGACLSDARFEALGKPDTTVVALRFASGAVGVIENRLRSAFGYETVLEVGGSDAKGVVRADELDRLTLLRDGRIERRHVPWFLERFPGAYRAELAAFARSLVEGVAPTPSLAEGLRVLAACEAAERSFREGRTVVPRPVTPP